MLDVLDTLRESLAPRYDVEREIGTGARFPREGKRDDDLRIDRELQATAVDTQQQATFVTFFIMIYGLMTDLERLTINTIPIEHAVAAARGQRERRKVPSRAS